MARSQKYPFLEVRLMGYGIWKYVIASAAIIYTAAGGCDQNIKKGRLEEGSGEPPQ